LRRLAGAPANEASWSRDGREIVYVRGSDLWQMRPDGQRLVTASGDRNDLMLVRTDGSRTRRLTHESGWFHGSPSWQRISE